MLAASAIVVAGLDDQIADADLIVVLGNAVASDGTPSPRLKARLDVALKLFRQHRAPIIFVSGGTGKEGFDEAVTMSNYLLKNGVPSGAIVKDSMGVDTAATAKNAANFMRAKSLKTAFVATQYFHVPRTRLALQRNGIQVTGSTHADCFVMRDLYSNAREAIAYAAYYAK
ncbi:MAG: YdcF family protein [Betaproteobacteria bacterium]|nr:YdcF family protein [Betaproteobacteria bacterium]